MSIQNIIKESEIGITERRYDDASDELAELFGIKIGGYIQYRNQWNNMKTARVMSASDVYTNAAGGYTAEVQVMPSRLRGGSESIKSVTTA